MRKILSRLGIIFFSYLMLIGQVNASESGVITGSDVRMRTGPSTSYYVISTLDYGASLIIHETKKGEDQACSSDWYRVTYNAKEGYVCGDYVSINYDNKDGKEPSDDYEKVLKNAGFPSSYWPYLKNLHNNHSQWVFKALNTNIPFSTVSAKENKIGVSLIQGNEGYRSTDSSVYNYYTNQWKALDGTNWYAANQQTVEYYLDPRNWLNEGTIFMFEDLSYNSAYHKEDMVSSILSATKLKDYDTNYISHFMNAARMHQVSPVYLASRVRQEVGSSTAVISGKSFSYRSKNYSGLYNPYNIGATSGEDNWIKGLIWANGGENGTDRSTTFSRPWTSLEKGIKGGAEYIAKGYINAKQNTTYLQKFNVANGLDKLASHQYMTNIKAPSSEATTTAASYKKDGIIDKSLVFLIPVYTNMPSKTTLPSTGNPNNYLKTLKVDGLSVAGFDGAKTSYTVNVAASTTTVDITATKVVDSAKISGTGKITLSGDKTTKNIIVTAQNGSKKTYTINIVKNDGIKNSPGKIAENAGYKISGNYISDINIGTHSSTIINKINNHGGNVTVKNASSKTKNDTLVTGDKVTISNGEKTNTYTVIIYGDSNGDGIVNSSDYVRIKNTIMTSNKLSGDYYVAADVNKDGKITSVDYVNVKNYILGKKTVLK